EPNGAAPSTGPAVPPAAPASRPDPDRRTDRRSMEAMNLDEPRLALLLALADDELIIGHRHSEWTGWVPHLEADLAFSSLAQDEMAHARLLYGRPLPSMGDGWAEARLALGRRPGQDPNPGPREWRRPFRRRWGCSSRSAPRPRSWPAASCRPRRRNGWPSGWGCSARSWRTCRSTTSSSVTRRSGSWSPRRRASWRRKRCWP